jgi:hypothetical protein
LYVSQFFLQLPLLSFFFVVNEESDSGYLRQHGIICVKSIVGHNNELETNLLKYFLTMTDYTDIIIKEKKTFSDRKNAFEYCFKTMNDPKIIEATSSSLITNIIFEYMYVLDNFSVPLLNKIQILFNKGSGPFRLRLAPYLYLVEKRNHADLIYSLDNLVPRKTITAISIQGAPIKEQNYNMYTLLNLINFYFTINNYYYFKGSIYKHILDSKLSVVFFCSLTNLVNNFDMVFSDLYNDFSYQFEGID